MAAKKNTPAPSQGRNARRNSPSEQDGRPARPRNEAASPPQMSRDEVRRAQALRKKKKNRRKKRITYGILLLFVIGIGVSLALTVFFHIESIGVEGNSLYSTEDIEAVAGIRLQENLFLCDAKGAVKRLVKQRPYIGSADVKRYLPGKIVIQVTETAARFAVPYHDAYLLLDQTGKVLETDVAQPPPDCARVELGEIQAAETGDIIAVADSAVIQKLSQLSAALDAVQLHGITRYDVSDSMNIRLVYQDRITLELGTMTDLQRKLALGARAIADQDGKDPGRRGKIDLSLSKKAYFSPERETAPPA